MAKKTGSKKGALVAVAVVVVAAAGFAAYRMFLFSELISGEKPTRSAYEDAAVELDYAKGRSGDYEKGTLLVCTGRVTEYKDGDGLIVDTADTEYGFVGDKVWVILRNRPDVERDAMVKIFGRYLGARRFSSMLYVQMGSTHEQIPFVQADYMDAIDTE